MRDTKQKQLILETLKPHKDHPTADEIYQEVRSVLPHISLGTVYRNLDKMSSDGEILKLQLGGGKKRFDPNPTSHAHFRCLKCGAVEDFPDHIEPVVDIPGGDNGWVRKRVILGVVQDFYGYCSKCSEEE